ncbi:hypothetical protein GW813_12760 [bacterium]|nr:hypothetical protein [bacterium]PIP84930.1 MAG: hypothetical protein COR54_01515 [Elusimicrobia bacterium CG22_combo_CG10-13_8_21_14_all_63_91]PJA13299.1 MAG: hypothetical protein COX66_15175 [Elusimicrobia bacterium CG_4_10_14_0_2_um_filter_63_34]PJB26131.1 MAG: hypothetical protein CO113_05155 [Elusimicrobia bacterium CG_4_9_14_3_um_filter_62_55]
MSLNPSKLVDDVANAIAAEVALGVFAHRRAKFEGWLKVKIVDLVIAQGLEAYPEIDRIDVVSLPDWAIQLKTTNTNYRFGEAIRVTRPITENVREIMADVDKLKAHAKYPNRGVLFVVFPCKPAHAQWKAHFAKLTPLFSSTHSKEFVFQGGLPGVVYLGIL